MIKEAIQKTYSRAAREPEPNLCCGVDYREEFSAEELDHIPEEVLNRNYGCGVPQGLRTLKAGDTVLDLGPGVGRDCFIAARKVGSGGRVVGLDMNQRMIEQAEQFKAEVVERLGYDNIEFVKGQFDVEIPLGDGCVDVILSNCVNNLAENKARAYQEMARVLSPGSKLSFSDVVSYDTLPLKVQNNEKAWADCVGGVLSYRELTRVLNETGFHGVILRTDYLWKTGTQIIDAYFHSEQLSQRDRAQLEAIRLYSVVIEAFKPSVDPGGECYWKGHYALYHGPGVSCQLDHDPDHTFRVGELKEVCEKTATILKSDPFSRSFTVFEPEGAVEARLCLPSGGCC